MDELTSFQVSCENRLKEALSEVKSKLVGRTIKGRSEKYITASTDSGNIKVWIYTDSAMFVCGEDEYIYEQPDYKSSNDLEESFIRSITECIQRLPVKDSGSAFVSIFKWSEL